MDGVAYLVSTMYEEDEIGQRIPIEEKRTEIFVTQQSIGRREWVDAGKNGFNSEIKLTTSPINYSGEEEVEYNGIRYAIYRTYTNAELDEIELYLQRKVGV